MVGDSSPSGTDRSGSPLDSVADGSLVDAFISYSWQDEHDRGFVEWLRDALEARGKRAWVDRRDIEPAADWRKRIERAIGSARAVVFVVSPASVSSSECARELEAATAAHKKLIPVVRREVDPVALPDALSTPNWIRCLTDRDRDSCLESVIEAMDTDLGWRDEHTRLAVRAKEWREARSDRSLLLRGRALRGAEEWYQSRGGHAQRPTMEQEQFLAASRRRSTARLRRALAVCVIGVVVLAALAVVAVGQRSDAVDARRLARSQSLAIQASELMESNVPLGMLLSIEAYELAPTAAAREALAAAASQPLLQLHVAGSSEDPVWSVAMSADGRVAAGTDSGRVLLWEDQARSGPVATWDGHGGPIRSLEFSPDGSTLAAGTADAGVVLWDIESGDPQVIQDGDGVARAIAFSPDGKTLAVGHDGDGDTGGGIVELWDVATRRQVGGSSTEGNVFALAYSPDGMRIAAGSQTGRVELLDATTAEQAEEIRASGPSVRAIAFGISGEMLAWGDDSGEATLWDLAEEIEARTFGRSGAVRTIGFDDSGDTILVGDASGRLGRWDVASGTQEGTWDGGAAVNDAAMSQEGDVVVSGDADGRVIVWNPAVLGAGLTWEEGSGDVVDAAFTTEGDQLATGDGNGYVAFWSTAAGAASDMPGAVLHHDAPVWAVAVRPHTKTIAVGDKRGHVLLWDPDADTITPLESDIPAGEGSGIRDLAYSQDGSMLIAASVRGYVAIWDGQTHQVIKTIRAGEAPRAVAISPDGATAAAGGSDRSGDSGWVTTWDTTSWSQTSSVTADGGDIWALAFSPDEETLAAGNRSGQILLWDRATEEQITLDGGGSALRGLDFHRRPDGATAMATGDLSGQVTVWNASTWARSATIDQPWPVWGVAFNPNGTQLVATGEGGHITLSSTLPWTGEFPTLKASICDAVGNLAISPAQWNQYLPDRVYRPTCQPR